MLVACNGSSKTGCRVVQVDCADARKAARRDRQKTVVKAMIMRWILSSERVLVPKHRRRGTVPLIYTLLWGEKILISPPRGFPHIFLTNICKMHQRRQTASVAAD